MSTATDTPDERLAEYTELFERALIRRVRGPGAEVFALRDEPGVREQAEDLARREAQCCPFLGYRVETAGGEVLFTVTGEVGASGFDAICASP
jgi:hypothetical protein